MKRVGFIDLHPENPDRLREVLERRSGDGGEIDSAISLYVFRSTAKGYEIETTAEHPSSFTPGEIDEFYLSLPASLLNFRLLKLPFSEPEKAREVLPFELDNLILGGSEGVVSDVVMLDNGDAPFNVLAVYIQKQLFKDILQRLAPFSLDPRIVTSLELPGLIKGGVTDLAQRLVAPIRLNGGDRVTAAREELTAPLINLRRDEFAYKRDREKISRALNVTALLSLVLALIINADILLGTISAKRESRAIRTELRQAFTALFPGQKKVSDELYQLKASMKSLKERGETLLGVNPLQFMLMASQRKTQGIVVNELSLGKETVSLKGEALSMNDIDTVKKSLMEFLANVSVSDIKPLPNGKILFTVVAGSLK